MLFREGGGKCLSAAAETGGPYSPEAAHELGEAGPLTGVIVPAAGHEGVENRWAEVGLG